MSRMNGIVPPACAKPLGRYVQAGESVVDRAVRFEKRVQSDNAIEKEVALRRECSGKTEKDNGKTLAKPLERGKI